MRLRPLTEAECYARCYGGHGDERVSFVRLLPRRSKRATPAGEQLRALFEERLDAHGPEAEAA
jgi:ribosomal protein S4